MRPYSVQPRQIQRMSVPNNNKWPTLKKLEENVINFPYISYPFPNQAIDAEVFSTLVQCNLNEDKIHKIVNFKCQNIINLKKIVKMKMKNKNQSGIINKEKNKISVTTYSFYYEKVQYSLDYIFQQKYLPKVLKLNNFILNRAQIKKIIANTIASLFKQGIIAFLQYTHIGITQKGVLKIYISPNVLFDEQQYNPKTKILVIKNLNNVLKDIDMKFPKTLKTKNSKQNFKINQISIQNDLIANEDSFIIDQNPEDKNGKNGKSYLNKKQPNQLLQNMQKSLNEQQQQNFIAISGSTNLDHLKFQSQMKKRLQSRKLAEKASKNINNQKKSHFFSKHQQKQKINQISIQLQQIRKKIRQKAQEKRQKNLYITNGFKTIFPQKTYQNEFNESDFQTKQIKNQNQNHVNVINYKNNNKKHLQIPNSKQNNFNKNIRNSTNTGVQNITRKRKSSESSVNFYQGIMPNQQNINCINIYNHHQNNKGYGQQVFYGVNNNNDDAMSVDTYEMEIGDDYQMPKMNNPGSMRKTLIPNRSKEELQGKIRQQQKTQQKARFYQSAGGKKFHHIVNMLKPQFQPKKSNIFQQPQMQNQEESKKSISIKKSVSKHSDPSQIDRRRQAKIKLSSSQNNLQKQIKGIKTLDQIKNDLNTIIRVKQPKTSLLTEGNHNTSNVNNSLNQDNNNSLQIQTHKTSNPQMWFYQSMNPKQQKSIQKSNIKYESLFKNKQTIQEKVKKAMQRTKKAIDVLNKARNRTPSPLKVSGPTKQSSNFLLNAMMSI